ncbi:hypothetical protein K9N68_11870 [Kovacikia minuta CCNUW1]|uniref:hypothetical protein n=1 Tax=Kovacikia minuta TaxID=2931930 RepID=UPI001CCB461A|nr:hypothetical protein [Kovacikia minuta]UBF28505.1 hypothetical protein K9N68_11870 [Kovacikia minuta CCNUW1]
MASSSTPFENDPNLGGISKELLVHLPEDSEIWQNLKHAIAASSGFQRWRLERSVDNSFTGSALDNLVRSYLRETLETLAY